MSKDKVEVKEEVKPEPVKPVIAGFKCCRCGGIAKIVDKGNEVCAECFAPTHWKA
mgnify:CR=1 FL=1